MFMIRWGPGGRSCELKSITIDQKTKLTCAILPRGEIDHVKQLNQPMPLKAHIECIRSSCSGPVNALSLPAGRPKKMSFSKFGAPR